MVRTSFGTRTMVSALMEIKLSDGLSPRREVPWARSSVPYRAILSITKFRVPSLFRPEVTNPDESSRGVNAMVVYRSCTTSPRLFDSENLRQVNT